MIDVIVDDRLRVDTRGVPDPVLEALKDSFVHKNPQFHKLKALGLPPWSEPREYRTWQGGPGELSVPRGGASRLREALAGYPIRFVDRRIAPACEMPEPKVVPRDYQEDAIAAMLAKENCIAQLPTGSGKTILAIVLAMRLKTPALFCVQNGALFEQWRDKLEIDFGLRRRNVGTIRSGKVNLRPLTVAMAQSLWKLKPGEKALVRDYFGTFVQDEVHRVGARTFMEVVDWMPARYRFGLSADPRRKDRKEFLVHDLFGQVAYEVTPAELEEVGAIVDVEVRVTLTDLRAEWYRTEDKQADHRLLEQITWDDDRTGLAADIALRERDAGHQVLIFSHRIEHCQRIRAALHHRGVQCGLMIGGPENEDLMADAVRRLKGGELRVAVGTIQAIGTGIDLPTISRGIVATPLASNKQLWGQVRGRLCRPDEGKEAIIHYLHDDSALGDLPVRMLARWNRRVLVDVGGMMVAAKDWIRSRLPAKDRMLEGLAAAVAEKGL